MNSFWWWIVGAAAGWALLLAVTAVVLRKRWRRTSLNPIEWIPAYFAIPVALLLGLLFYLFIYPIIVVGMIVAHRHWRKNAVIASLTSEGVVLQDNDSKSQRLLKWEEIQQWRIEQTRPFPTFTAVLNSGERVPVDAIEDDFEERIREHGIEWRDSEDDHAIERGRLDAPVNRHGFARCPHCGTSFPIDSQQVWDGNMHIACRTRLRLVQTAID